ncbi:MAG TPA: M20 family metallopeptidase [Candidatus Limnocylindrales bacterium]|nr:M20 family metallopeptidase [Candidatus Limnocylindrales bacterium]
MTLIEAPGSLVTEQELAAIRQTVEGGLEAFLADLERLCSIDCGSYTPAGVNEVALWVAAELESMGATVDRRPDPAGRFGDTVIGTFEGRSGAGPRILLIGHMDTVFEEGTVAKRPFRIDDGTNISNGRPGRIARGPGVSDMKAGLLAGLRALAVLRELGGGSLDNMPFERITFIANPDEEIGSPSSTPHIVEKAREADAAFVLECARATGEFVSERKGIADLRIRVFGKAAHAGVEPEKGRSAILAASDLVRGIHALNGRWPEVTANVGVFRAGTRPNIVCDEAELHVDVRATTAANLENALVAIRELAVDPSVPGCTTDIETMAGWPPMEKLERSGRLADHTIELARRLGFETEDVATGGASDANTTSGMGVPTIDGLGPIGGMDHSPDEYLEVDSIVPRTALLAALLLEVGRDPVVASWRTAPAS